MTTALQLVNRVLKKSRENTVTALTASRAVPILDLLNEGKNWAMESWAWEFDRRTDGTLVTMPSISGTDAAATNDSAVITLPGVGASAVSGEWVSRIVISSDDSFGDTAFRIVSVATSGANLNLTIATDWPGTTTVSGTYKVFANEYVLPSTVRRVTAFRYQEDDVALSEVQHQLGLDRSVIRPHEDVSDDTWRVSVGGTIMATYDSDLVSAGTEGVSVQLDPTPSSELVYHYDWVYKHPELTASQDLENVTPAVTDLIVEYAYAATLMGGVNADPDHGERVLRQLKDRAKQIFNGHTPDPSRRIEIRPHFETVRGHRGSPYFGRLPKETPGL